MSNDNYLHFVIQLTRSIIRIHLGHPLEFSFSLSSKQDSLLQCLVDTLQDSTTSRRRRMIAYHNLVWSLVDVDVDQAQGQESWGNPIQRAIWLKALRPDGNFYGPSDFTPDLAKLKYLCNMTALLEALLDKDDITDKVHGDDIG